jgi:hypothetical protein
MQFNSIRKLGSNKQQIFSYNELGHIRELKCNFLNSIKDTLKKGSKGKDFTHPFYQINASSQIGNGTKTMLVKSCKLFQKTFPVSNYGAILGEMTVE